MSRVPFVVGNWKMFKTVDEAHTLVKELAGLIDGIEGVDFGVAPPYTALSDVSKALKGTSISLAAQNLFYEEEGAFTGEISAKMLLDVGVDYVILGHSERRHIFQESNDLVNRKVVAALEHGLKPIVCVGETLGQRQRSLTFMVVDDQLRDALVHVPKEDATKITVAYEPVWAIGTGETATSDQAQEVHEHIRARLVGRFGEEAAAEIRIQYGGSVKPDNAKELLTQPDIDGALVGGASLKAESFAGIIKAGAGSR